MCSGFAFSFPFLILIHLIHHLIVNSLNEKPLGNQSIFDAAISDTFFIMALPYLTQPNQTQSDLT
jgi:hypothetical protein